MARSERDWVCHTTAGSQPTVSLASPAVPARGPSLFARTKATVRERWPGDASGVVAVPTAVELTVATFLAAWLDEVLRLTVRPRTTTSYGEIVRLHLVPGLGHLRLRAMTPADVQAFLNAKSASGLAPRTVASLRGVPLGALGHARPTLG